MAVIQFVRTAPRVGATPRPDATPPVGSSDQSDLSDGSIAGIALGVVAVLAAVVAAAFILMRRNRQRKRSSTATDDKSVDPLGTNTTPAQSSARKPPSTDVATTNGTHSSYARSDDGGGGAGPEHAVEAVRPAPESAASSLPAHGCSMGGGTYGVAPGAGASSGDAGVVLPTDCRLVATTRAVTAPGLTSQTLAVFEPEPVRHVPQRQPLLDAIQVRTSAIQAVPRSRQSRTAGNLLLSRTAGSLLQLCLVCQSVCDMLSVT